MCTSICTHVDIHRSVYSAVYGHRETSFCTCTYMCTNLHMNHIDIFVYVHVCSPCPCLLPLDLNFSGLSAQRARETDGDRERERECGGGRCGPTTACVVVIPLKKQKDREVGKEGSHFG